MPPTLLVTSTRDLLLSNTTIFHPALLRADDEARLVVYESLPHDFWYHFQLPNGRSPRVDGQVLRPKNRALVFFDQGTVR
jgi:acetyl esterase/lipase